MEFIELVFQRQLNLIESIHDGELLQLELNRYKKFLENIDIIWFLI